jgi:uncharacterized protein (DUF2237 family)
MTEHQSTGQPVPVLVYGSLSNSHDATITVTVRWCMCPGQWRAACQGALCPHRKDGTTDAR